MNGGYVKILVFCPRCYVKFPRRIIINMHNVDDIRLC